MNEVNDIVYPTLETTETEIGPKLRQKGEMKEKPEEKEEEEEEEERLEDQEEEEDDAVEGRKTPEEAENPLNKEMNSLRSQSACSAPTIQERIDANGHPMSVCN